MADPPQDKPPTGGALAKLLALESKIEVIKDRVQPLEDAVGGLVDTLDDLVARQKAAKPAPAWWPRMGEGERDARWAEFTAWLRDVLAARYPADADKLVKCWASHPVVVDALTAAWLTWQAAYLNPAADARDSAQWQMQWRPQLLEVAGDDEHMRRCRDKGAHMPADGLSDDLLGSFR